MLRSKIVAALLAAALAFSPVNVSAGGVPKGATPSTGHSTPVGVWLIFGCAASIIVAAAVASSRHNRQLTQSEALTCGLLFWLNSPQPRRR